VSISPRERCEQRTAQNETRATHVGAGVSSPTVREGSRDTLVVKALLYGRATDKYGDTLQSPVGDWALPGEFILDVVK